MNKDDFVLLLQSVGILVNEGFTAEKNKNNYPRIDFWSYIWSYQNASGDAYADVKTYQVSYYDKRPPESNDSKIMELREILKSHNITPEIFHEFVSSDKVYHSYFSVDLYG